MMYSLALMTYDAPYGITPSYIKTRAQLKDHQTSMSALWNIHRLVLDNFKDIDPDDYNKENYDQYGMFYELMRVIPGGDDLVMEVVGRLPRTTGNRILKNILQRIFLCVSLCLFKYLNKYFIISNILYIYLNVLIL